MLADRCMRTTCIRCHHAFLHKVMMLQRCKDETIDAPLRLASYAISSMLL